ncbi:SNF2 family N-terminal domain-containing protein [Trichoderma sp. SZMC 28013]
MSNPLKRRFDPVRELDDEAFFTSSVETQQPYGQEMLLEYDGYHDSMRQSQYHGPSCMNPMSDVPIIQQADSLPEVFSNLLVDPNLAPSMNFNDLDFNLDDALTDWSNDMLLSGSDLSPLGPPSSQEVSHSPSVASEAGQPRIEDVSSIFNNEVADNEIICYGMLHNVDVKLLGDMQTIFSKLDKSEAGLERFKLEKRENHVILRFSDTSEDFGQVRSNVGTTLSSLLGNKSSNVEFEPIVSTSYLMDIIGRANRPSEAIVKVDINVYGPQLTAMKVGDDLSSGKLWLQKPSNMRCEIIYDNPHFLRLKLNGVQIQPKQPAKQIFREGSSSRRKRETQLRNMLEEVYTSIQTREINAVEGGDRVVQTLKRHQKKALGFMLERETGIITDRYRLWEPIPVEGGNTEYRHKITRAKNRTGIQPSERGGGILADEMGMGKTLSMLTLIMKTLDDGKEWAKQQENGAKVDEAIKRSRSTLVIVPSALLIYNWINEITDYLEQGVKVIKYHSSDRPKDIEQIADSDIVITTYSTLTAEHQIKTKQSLLHSVDWYRVVLDEAHIIRRRATAFYQACDAIYANSRWCLTGTPIQNKLADIGTLFAFIRAEPFIKAANFRKYIEVPFEQIPENESPTLAKDRLILLFQAFCLRRTKEIVNLPRLRKTVRKLSFSVEERQHYENTKEILLRTMRHRVGEVEQNSKFGLFQVNLQMRLLCNHGTYQQPFSWHRQTYRDECEALISPFGQSGEFTCAGCQMPMSILGSSRLNHSFYEQCAHVLCSECIAQSNTPNDGGKAQHCPICIRWVRHTMVESDDDGSVPNCPPKDKVGDDEDYFNKEGYSTKMNALVEDVRRDLKSKSIIFSCWTRTLQLLRRYLGKAKIPYLDIDGTCSLKERKDRLEQFKNDVEKPVLIMTTGTGGFGLNITCASRIFIVELQWNPAVESQAIARAIRLGQEKDVHVTRYVIKDTVEEEMGSQQQSKNQLASLVDAGDDMDWLDENEQVVEDSGV